MWGFLIVTVVPGLKHHFQPVARVLLLPLVGYTLPDLQKDVDFIYPI
jgi:hypothetical protein